MQTWHTNCRPSDIPVQKEVLKSRVLKVSKWPVSKSELTNRNLKHFIRYINSADLEKINRSNEQM